MGITFDVYNFFHDTIKTLEWDLHGKKICDLGDQIFCGGRMINLKGLCKVGDYYRSLGMDYTSIDLNGNEGALKLDLGKPITDVELMGKFDIVTDYGVLEHIQDEKVCLDNIYNLCKEGGLIVHCVPSEHNTGMPHGLRLYSLMFFEKLAVERGYRIINKVEFNCNEPPHSNEYSIGKLVCVAFLRGK